ncbi:ABC transporter substrate-binding protein [Marinivivus vitaminiproducens]|uniref:ABC transporter substrate-binding protein n=1 Tax=Marinivivus vitaminiproducens TaxID=3035935 RepID=UPI002799B4EE|nr:ABC transporter substrate-binding protein [Geminicoccaceae bacterium SCSIO 64248]
MRWTCAIGGLAAVLIALPVAAQDKTTLRWASQGDALTYDPHAQNESPTNAANNQVYETLVSRNAAMEREPALATSWENVEPTIWEFKLREGVTFHEGQDFTADDVVFSLNRSLRPTSQFRTILANVDRVEAVDPLTVRIHTKKPAPILPDEVGTIYIMSKSWAEEHGVTEPQDFSTGQETYAVRNANGTGPYKLTLREPDVRTIITKNEDWWGSGTPGNPHAIDEVVYTPIKNGATRIAALLSGELDFVLDPPFQDLQRLEQSGDLKIQTTPQVRTIFFGMEQERDELLSSDVKGKNPFKDIRVRQAVYQAIDIEAIRKRIMRDLSAPAGVMIAPAVHGYSDALNERLPYDPDAAKALLAEAGYPEGFSVKLDCPNDRYNNDEPICQAAVGMLGRVGIEVTLDAQSKSLHFPKLQRGESDFYMLGWGVQTMDSHYVLNNLYRSNGPTNYGHINIPELDQLTDAIGTEIDLDKRDALIEQAWTFARDNVLYAPLHHQVIAWAMKKDLNLPIQAQDEPYFRWASWSAAN